MTVDLNPRSYLPVPSGRLWAGMILGPVIWALHLVVIYAVQSVSCHLGLLQGSILGMSALRFVLLAITAAALAGVLAGGWLSYRNYRRLEGGRERGRGLDQDRPGFMALAGTLLSGLFLLSLIYTVLAVFTLQPCALFWW